MRERLVKIVEICTNHSSWAVKELKELIGNGADPNSVTSEGIPIIVLAVAKNLKSMVEQLRESGADLKCLTRRMHYKGVFSLDNKLIFDIVKIATEDDLLYYLGRNYKYEVFWDETGDYQEYDRPGTHDGIVKDRLADLWKIDQN